MAGVTALERALAHTPRQRAKPVTEDEIALTLAWLRGEITISQVAVGLGRTTGGTQLHRIAVVCRELYRTGALCDGPAAPNENVHPPENKNGPR